MPEASLPPWPGVRVAQLFEGLDSAPSFAGERGWAVEQAIGHRVHFGRELPSS
jgi:hypothetical protein